MTTDLTEALNRIGPIPTVETFDPESLLKLPPTDVLARQLDAAQAEQHKHPDELARRIREADRRHRQGLTRDAIQATRPDGCTCLGTGALPFSLTLGGQVVHYGARRVYPTVPAPGAYGKVAPATSDPDVFVYSAYCPCPDGARTLEAHRRRLHGGTLSTEAARRERLWDSSGVPPLYSACTLDNFPVEHRTRDALATLRRWLIGDKPILLLWGEFGTGKTSLAISLLRALVLDQGNAGLFTTVAELLHALRLAMDTPNTSPDKLLADLQRLDVLVLDDLGAENAKGGHISDWAEEQLYLLLDYRKNHQHRTLITSNLRPADLVEHVGKRIVWRALEFAVTVHLDGPNLRERQPATTRNGHR